MYEDIDNYKKEEQAKRLAYDKEQITALGYAITHETETELNFLFKNHNVKLFPYSGWFSGKSVKDGRGLKNLLKQIAKQKPV